MEILHLSDLHYRESDPFQQALIEALLTDLEAQRANGFTPDVIVFSGDLVNNPDDSGIYSKFEKVILEPIVRILRVKTERVVICPGNHDVSRSNIKAQKMVYENLHEKVVRRSLFPKALVLPN